MKIKSIEKDQQVYVFIVTFEPNWIERFFKVSETQKKYKDTGEIYTYPQNGNDRAYLNQLGEYLGNGHKVGVAIDAWRRRW